MSQENSEPKTIGEILSGSTTPIRCVPDEQISDWERQQEARRRLEMHNRFIEARGERYAMCKLSNFECNVAGQSEVVAKLKQYGEDFESEIKRGTNIIAFGPKGTGKDHLLSAMANGAIRLGVTVEWVNGADLFGLVRDRIGAEQSEASLIQSYVRPTVLYISDPLPPIGNITDFQAATLFRILDGRYSRMRPTWCTVNVADGVELEQRMGAQNADRLRDGALALYCNWPSYRKVRS